MPLPDLENGIFVNEFQKGSQETANLGFGTMLGIENYTVKGTARLTKDTVKVSGSVVTDLPLFVAVGSVSSTIFMQGSTGKVYVSTNTGNTWTDMTNAGSSGSGQGIIFYNGYLFAFRGGRIDYTSTTTTSWTQTNWQPNATAPSIYSVTNAVPLIIFPNDSNVYFGNGFRVGKLGFGSARTFNPAGTAGVDYFYSDNFVPNQNGTSTGGLLPNFYTITSISFLPVNFIALGTSSAQNSAVADVILWNPTLSTYETPLRLYSQAPDGANGVKQLINRNNVLYAVVGGSQTIFTTNGTTFNQVADLSLYSNIRQTTGQQSTSPVFLNPLISAIDIFGNKLLTGVSTPNSISYYPASNGLYPAGIWSVAFQQDGSNSIQCEYTISTNTTVATAQYRIGVIKCTDTNQTLIGWQDGSTFGIDQVSTTSFQNTDADTAIESQMMEIGTPLEPSVITAIQLNLVRSLITGQSISVYWRNAFDQPYVLVPGGNFTSANGDVQNNNSLKITVNNLGTIKFLQLKIIMSTDSPNVVLTPEIRNVIVTGK